MQVLSSDDQRDPIFTAFDQAVMALEQIEIMPTIVQRVMAITSNPDCSITDLLGAISSSVGLAARIMRVANSASYGARAVQTLREALVRIGMRDIRRIAITASMTSGAASSPGFERAAYRNALLTACYADALCGRGRVSGVKDAFLCGLFHDIGTLALARIRGDEYGALVGEPGRSDQPAVEAEAMGFDHCDLGALIAQSWKFGEEIEYAILLHHTPFAGSKLYLGDGTERSILVTGLAVELASRHEADDESPDDDQSGLTMGVSMLDLSAEQVETAVDEARASFAELERALLSS